MQLALCVRVLAKILARYTYFVMLCCEKFRSGDMAKLHVCICDTAVSSDIKPIHETNLVWKLNILKEHACVCT